MKKYLEPSRSIPVKEEVDVLVVGAGPAGFSAAVNAARQGVRVMLIEQSGTVGGIATAGLMSHWTGQTQGPFYEELLTRAKDCSDAEADEQVEVGYRKQLINHEKLKTVMLEMLMESGVILQLYTFACDVIMYGKVAAGVITESKSGREVILAKVVIDATGDGDIAAKAGAPYVKGRQPDGKMQPMTLMFRVGGVDYSRAVFITKFEDSVMLPQGDLQTLGRKHIPHPAGHILLYRSSLPGVVTCNMTNSIQVDGTRAEDLTKAEITCRGQMDVIVRFLREYVPGYENCYIVSCASIIGVRETRHFVGDNTLTEQDILSARVFDDWIVTRAHFNFDVHNVSGAGLDETGVQAEFKQQQGYTIPYGCFLPKGVEDLLLAGRNISGTHMAHSSYRAMPICVNMGQGAGVAAALSAKKGIYPRNLDVKVIQEVLKMNGVEI